MLARRKERKTLALRGFLDVATCFIVAGLTLPVDTIVTEFFEYKQSHLRVITELFSAVLRIWVGITERERGVEFRGRGLGLEPRIGYEKPDPSFTQSVVPEEFNCSVKVIRLLYDGWV